MASHLQPGSLGLRVVLYFARNLDEELRAVDVSEKFGCPASNVAERLRKWVRADLLALESNGIGGSGRHATYRAGPQLFEILNVRQPEAKPAAQARDDDSQPIGPQLPPAEFVKRFETSDGSATLRLQAEVRWQPGRPVALNPDDSRTYADTVGRGFDCLALALGVRLQRGEG